MGGGENHIGSAVGEILRKRQKDKDHVFLYIQYTYEMFYRQTIRVFFWVEYIVEGGGEHSGRIYCSLAHQIVLTMPDNFYN